MPEITIDTVRAAVANLRVTAGMWAGTGLTEQDTKNAIIEPMLAALGWPKEDLNRVRAEFRHTAKANPVDYALFDGRKPLVFVEAKGLDKSLDDFKFIQQVISYGATAGIEWAVITNGWRWDLYAVLAKSAVTEKRVFSCTLGDEEIAEWLLWVTPERVQGAKLTSFWQALSADRVVRDTVIDLFARRDEELVSLIASRTHLRPHDVAEALGVLQPSFARASVGDLTKVADKQPGTANAMFFAPEPPAPRTSTTTTIPEAPSTLGEPLRTEPPTIADGAPTVSIIGSGTPSGTRPLRVRVRGAWAPVKSWVEVLMVGLAAFATDNPAAFDACFDNDSYQGRKRRILSRNPTDHRKPGSIGNGFVEQNLSAGKIIDLLRQVQMDVGGPELAIEVQEGASRDPE
ncbi:MAG TPA: type I restriction enzyme HsdR N-terminal domain-containing protein [Myxococcota bacterium]|nr:type I restriction enzyme HsdR N-terminal domain-containing protein [Myxococcota bacterium]